MDFLLTAGIILYLGITIYLANAEQVTGRAGRVSTRLLLYFVPGIFLWLGLNSLLAPSLPEIATDPVPVISEAMALLCAALSAVGFVLTLSILNSGLVRRRLAALISRAGRFEPDSIVHVTAAVLTILVVVANVIIFLLAGGTEALAANIEVQGISLWETIFQGGIEVAAAFLGVGYLIRRSLPQAFQRLGLRAPTPQDVSWGLAGTVLIYAAILVVGVALTVFVTQEQLEEQTQAAENLQNQFNTLPSAVILAASAALGEEILFRGALQPVFGLALTTIAWAVLHSQVLLSPALAAIIIAGIGFGLLRQRYSTTAAVIAHFCYNFLSLLITIAAGSGSA
jgi:hypothetical protein